MLISVLIMSLRVQFVKCILCVILYIILCFFLLKIKRSFYWIEQPHSISVINSNQSKEICIKQTTKEIVEPANFEIDLLEHDEMNGQSINLQESVMLLRQISNVCNKYNLKTTLTRRHFFYNSKHKSMYCWIRKVASTSFTKLFSDMKNRRVMRNYYREVNILAPKSVKELQRIVNDRKIFKLLVVRHPFQRLVSSYRDRIEDNSKRTAQSWIFARKIFRVTRPELFHSNATSGNFQQRVFTADKRLKIIPTFKEFLLWLLQNSEKDDVHWDQYYTHCAACSVRYNYVLKLDDYSYGQINYIFTKFGLDKTKVYLPKLEQTRGGYTDFVTTCKYFSSLTQDIIMRLYERYKIDFEMYNYDVNRYVFCAKKTV